MDELVRHCLRELSFDGDLGCDVKRLREFVDDFYASDIQQPQTVDDAFYAFVWSIIVQQPTVLVGLKPSGIASDVYIAEQRSKKKKAGDQLADVHEERPTLELVENAQTSSLDELIAQYGDKLRIAVDPDTSYAAITGTHLRSSKLSPMVYTALQLISRGRSQGISVVDLGKYSGYDQKTCFYLVRQLIELDLVAKCRRPGVGANFVILKYFYDRDPFWQGIRNEGARVNDDPEIQPEEQDLDPSSTDIHFDPIDSRHLSSLDLVRSRIVKLLKAQERQMFLCTNILVALGFAKPTKKDRRFFATRVKELIQQGVIERVSVPKTHEAIGVSGQVQCFRLVSGRTPSDDHDNIKVLNEEEEEKEDEQPEGIPGLKSHTTVHKQISDLIETSGTLGMTSGELSRHLCGFDKRTIELLLLRAAKNPPPPHLRDLGTTDLMENFGRERRHRWWTDACFQALADKDSLGSTNGPQYDFSAVGQFAVISRDMFYANQAELAEFVDSQCVKPSSSKASRKKLTKPRVNPVLPDGTVKRGRPRKDNPLSKKRRKAGDADLIDGDGDINEPPKAKRGRPPKRRKVAPDAEDTHAVEAPAHYEDGNQDDAAQQIVVVPPEMGTPTVANRKRGRPPKQPLFDKDTDSPDLPVESVSKKRIKRNDPQSSSAPPESLSRPDTRPSRVDSLVPAKNPDRTSANHTESQSPLLSSVDTINETQNISLRLSPKVVPLPTSLLSMGDLGEANMSITEVIPTSVTPSNDPFNIDPALIGSGSGSPHPNNKSRIKNVSQMRRENELVRVVNEAGGIMSLYGNNLFDAHTALLETLVRAGEGSSAPIGTRLDKRTAMACFNSLAEKNRVKLLKTTIITGVGNNRPVSIVYLPGIAQTQINEFLVDLGRVIPIATPAPLSTVTITAPVVYGTMVGRSRRKNLPMDLLQLGGEHDDAEAASIKAEKADQLFSHDEATIKEVLLTERSTIGQLFGYVVGKAQRARTLHLCAMHAFDHAVNSNAIVSHELRIVDLSYFYTDISLATFCALVCPPEYSQELSNIYAAEGGKLTPVKDLPKSLTALLQVHLSRTRLRLIEILETLRSLGVVTPLFATNSDVPSILCPNDCGHPTAFDLVASHWTTTASPSTTPYWLFSTVAPIKLWALSEASPPFWKDVTLTSTEQAISFWDDLQMGCTNSQASANIECSNIEIGTESTDAPSTIGRSLRRKASWNTSYVFTWHQEHYLRRFITPRTAETPLDESNGAGVISKISGVISAPDFAVREFYDRLGQKMKRQIAASERRIQQQELDDAAKAQKAEAGKLRLQEKAREAKVRKEKAWDDMVSRVHPDKLQGSMEVRIRRLRSTYMQSAKSEHLRKWEDDIREAIHEAKLATSDLLASSKSHSKTYQPPSIPRPVIASKSTPSQVRSGTYKSVEALIAQQGPAVQAVPPSKSRKRKRVNGSPTVGEPDNPARRRHRFHWDQDYDELARDTYAVIKARVQPGTRIEWAAVAQVFPALPINSFRARINTLKSGNEAYFSRLEDRWRELWVDHRGTAELPDDDPASITNFNLARHVDFLRKHVDKSALRMGHNEQRVLSSSVDRLHQDWNVIESNDAPLPPWGFMWDAFVDDGREKRLMKEPFARGTLDAPDFARGHSEEDLVTQAIVKMVFGTPHDRYDVETGAKILHARDEKSVSIATEALLARGVLAQRKKRNSNKPGRGLKISEGNQFAARGSLSRDIFLDAVGMDEMVNIDTDEWRLWPLLASDGETAMLLQMVSDGKVEFSIDTAQSQANRPLIDWNSKRADDDQIENAISVRFHKLDVSALPRDASPSPSSSHDATLNARAQIHGSTFDEKPACCSLSSEGIVDCLECLDLELSTLLSSIEDDHAAIVHQILDIIRASGSKGATKDAIIENIDSPPDEILPLIQRMTEGDTPLLWKTGYITTVVVSASNIQPWTLIIADEPLTRIFPRRWFDITGRRISDVWTTALDAIMGTIAFRPGISQRDIFWIHHSAYDKLEIDDILRYLSNEGVLQRRSNPNLFEITDSDEDKTELEWEPACTFWFIAEGRRWYQTSSQ